MGLVQPLREPYIAATALFQRGFRVPCYAASSQPVPPNLKSIPVHTAWIAGLHGET